MRVSGESTALWGGEFAQSKPVFNRARSIRRCFYRQRLRFEDSNTMRETKKGRNTLMLTVANVFRALRSSLLLFARRRRKGISQRETVTGMVMTGTSERSEVMNEGFNMQTEIAKLAERIVEPVAAKLTMQELEHVVGQIRHAFEQFNT